jgi:hypothetical protein
MEDHSPDPSVAVDELLGEENDELWAYTKQNGFDSREATYDSNESEDGNPIRLARRTGFCDGVPAMKSASRHQIITDNHRQLRRCAPQCKPKASPKKRDVNVYQIEDAKFKDTKLQVGEQVYAPNPNQDPKNEQCEWIYNFCFMCMLIGAHTIFMFWKGSGGKSAKSTESKILVCTVMTLIFTMAIMQRAILPNLSIASISKVKKRRTTYSR